MIVDQGGMSFESFEGQLAATAQAIVLGGTSAPANGDDHADLLCRMEEDYGIVFPRSHDDELELGGAQAPEAALGNTQGPQIGLLELGGAAHSTWAHSGPADRSGPE